MTGLLNPKPSGIRPLDFGVIIVVYPGQRMVSSDSQVFGFSSKQNLLLGGTCLKL